MKKNFLTAATLASLTCFEARTEDLPPPVLEEEIPSSTIEQDVKPAEMPTTVTSVPQALSETPPVAAQVVDDNIPHEGISTNKVDENIEMVEGSNEGEEDEDEPSVVGSDSTEKPNQKDFFVVNDPPSSDEEGDE